jgi:hypothetical protein
MLNMHLTLSAANKVRDLAFYNGIAKEIGLCYTLQVKLSEESRCIWKVCRKNLAFPAFAITTQDPDG